MITYQYEIYINDTWTDITNYVETNAPLADRKDETLNFASFTISHIKSDTITGLDLSKAIKPYIPVIITINNGEDVFGMYTADTTCSIIKKTDDKLYQHTVGLIEDVQILKRKNIPNVSISQPKSEVFVGSIYSDNKPTGDLPINNTPIAPTLTNINESTDTSIIEGNVLKANNSGEVYLTFDINNKQFNVDQYWFGGRHLRTSAEGTLQVEILSNGSVLDTFTIDCKPGSYSRTGSWVLGYDYTLQAAGVTTKGYSFTIPEDTIDQTITFRMQTLGSYTVGEYFWVLEDIVNVYNDTLYTTSYMTLSADASAADTSEEHIYIDTLIDKLLDIMEIKDTADTTSNQYVLSDDTRARVSNILAPETTFQGYTLWDALEQLARLVNATPIIEPGTFNTIAFDFLDDIADIEYDQSIFEEETTAYTLENYNSGLESNASNLIEEDSLKNGKIEPYDGGWMSVRANSEIAAQLTEDNSAFKTRQPIFRVYNGYIKGIAVQITNDTLTKTLYGNLADTNNELNTSYFDISTRIVDFEEWNILDRSTQNKSDTLRRAVRTQGNTIYYTSGTNYVEGLNNTTLTTSDLFGSTNVPRALMESVMTAVAEYIYDEPTYSGYRVVDVTNSDGEIAIVNDHELFEDVLFRINYMPMIDARSTVYKHNAYSLGVDSIKYFNEQDTINDTTHLGKYIKTSLNKQGNLQYTVSGITESYGSIPKLGYLTYNDLVVSARDMNLNKKRIDYTLTLSKDFINQNSNMRPNSKHRIFEISSDDVVFRQDIYREFIVLTKNKANILPKVSTSLSTYGNQKLVQNFASVVGSNNYPISYAKASIVKVNGSSASGNEIDLDLPVNGYPLGTTVNLQLEFDTNRSAGPKIDDEQVAAVDTKIQTYTDYTSRFGKVYSIGLELHPRGIVDNTYTDADIYPEFNQASDDDLFLSLDTVINKDSREKYGIILQFPFIPEDSDVIRTFEGIAKYNGLIRNKDEIEVGVALLEDGYWPTVNQSKIQTERTLQVSTVGTSVYDTTNDLYGIKFVDLPIPANTRYEGYAVYEKTTKELIYAVKEDIAPLTSAYAYTTDLIEFVSRKYLVDNTRPT